MFYNETIVVTKKTYMFFLSVLKIKKEYRVKIFS